MAKRKRRPAKAAFDLDIVIPVYGRPDLLQKCLDSIEATKGDLNIKLILVDDNGPAQEELNSIYISLNGTTQIIRHKENAGFPRTVNDGIARGIAPLVLILNTDIELQPGALQAMIAEFKIDDVGIVGPKLLFPLDSTDPHRPAGAIQHAGLGVDFEGRVTHLNIGWPANDTRVNERRELQAVTGACLMIRRQVLNTVLKWYHENGDPTRGPFNELYGRGTYEDVELCFAARNQGYKVIYTPEAVAYHHVGASVMQDNGGYPTGRNEMIFKARCGNLLQWDEWRYI